MLIKIAAFLLETIFFFLIAAALLRACMNRLQIRMAAQPGPFVMAITDWLVKPLRQALPVRLKQSRTDWASICAAVLLALLYATLWFVFFTGLFSLLGTDFSAFESLFAVLTFALKMLLKVALQTLQIVVLVFAVLSWVQPGSPLYSLLGRLTEPLLSPIRRVLPLIGGVDLSALVLLVMAQIALMLLG